MSAAAATVVVVTSQKVGFSQLSQGKWNSHAFLGYGGNDLYHVAEGSDENNSAFGNSDAATHGVQRQRLRRQAAVVPSGEDAGGDQRAPVVGCPQELQDVLLHGAEGRDVSGPGDGLHALL